MDTQTQFYTTEIPDVAISLDTSAFDRAIRSQGVQFVHYRAMRCPVGLIDRFDQRRPHEDHSGCSNGFIYTLAGKATCLFTGNGKSTDLAETGAMENANVSVTLPRSYDGSDKLIHVAPFDRLYLSEENIAVVDWQLFEAKGVKDKLNFPAVLVDDLMDSNGVRYYQGLDFDLSDGQILWKQGKGPGMDPQTGKGTICAIRYMYRPFWYITRLLHEVRVAQAPDPQTGKRVIQRMPQAVVLQREYISLKEDSDEQAPTSARQVMSPDFSFGPRF